MYKTKHDYLLRTEYKQTSVKDITLEHKNKCLSKSK